MKSFESEIQKYAEKTRLKAVEREMIRERILSYMEYHPLKKQKVNEHTLTLLPQKDFIFVSFSSMWVRATGATLALVLVVGVPLLAERSVPGDVLYLVKTGVNEEIRTQLATSPYEKVALETKLIERRIAEARFLASEGKLTGEVEAKIAKTVKGHADAVQDGLAELRENDVDGAALAEIEFTSALEVQSAVLDESHNTSSSSVGSLISVVNTVRAEVASDLNPSAPSYEGLMARIESETTRSYELFESVKESATGEEITDIQRRLNDIDRSIVGGKALREIDETSAITEMVTVLGQIQKLISFLTDIDVRETVALETLVPVILTTEERVGALKEKLSLMEETLIDVDARVVLLEDVEVLEKIAIGRENINLLLVAIHEAVKEEDVETGEQKSLEAEALLKDLELMSIYTVDPVISEDPVLPLEEGNASTTPETPTDVSTTTTVVTDEVLPSPELE